MQVSSRSFEMKLMGPARCAAQLSIFFASIIFPSLSRAQAPIFELSPIESWINFHVKSSVKIAGKFDKWDAALTFTSPDETTGVLERSEEHTSELQSPYDLVCRLLLEKKKKKKKYIKNKILR